MPVQQARGSHATNAARREALAAGLSGAVESSGIIVTAGLAEVAAGAIAMGLGGYLAARTDAEHYASEQARKERETQEMPEFGTAKTVKHGTVILHSRADDVVPFADSEELVRSSGLPASALIEVGKDHRLADPEPLEAMLRASEEACINAQ